MLSFTIVTEWQVLTLALALLLLNHVRPYSHRC